MAHDIDIRATAFQDSSKTLLARVVGADAAAVKQADIASIEYTIYALASTGLRGDAVEGHEAVELTVADTIYDTLQTDDRWTKDTTGYNFAHELDVSEHAAFPTAGVEYLVEVTLTPTTGQILIVRYRIAAT